MQLRTLWPFPEEEVKAFIDGADQVFIIENSFTGQLDRLIRYVVGPLEMVHPVLKYNGKPFRPIEIIDAVAKFAPVREQAGVR